MRADALQRRNRILLTARRLFAAHGPNVALEQVAEASEVGIATLYRNFSTREELIYEVLHHVISDLDTATQRALQLAPSVENWTRYLRELTNLDLGAFTGALDPREIRSDIATAQAASLRQLTGLVESYVAAGVIHDGVSASNLMVSIGIATRPQPQAVTRIAPDAPTQLVDAYITWTLA